MLKKLWAALTHSASIVESAETAYITMSPSGRMINAIDPSDLPSIEDTAWHLANIARFTGAVRGVHYSVAEHAVRVSRLCDEYPLEGLCHDNSEAVLGDVSSPLKKSSVMVAYRVLEDLRARQEFRSLGLTYPLPDEVHYWDKWCGNWEYKELVASGRYTFLQHEVDFALDRWNSLGPLGWDAMTARTRFLARFEALMRQRGEAGKSL